jgi:hypothetical protein
MARREIWLKPHVMGLTLATALEKYRRNRLLIVLPVAARLRGSRPHPTPFRGHVRTAEGQRHQDHLAYVDLNS